MLVYVGVGVVTFAYLTCLMFLGEKLSKAAYGGIAYLGGCIVGNISMYLMLQGWQ